MLFILFFFVEPQDFLYVNKRKCLFLSPKALRSLQLLKSGSRPLDIIISSSLDQPRQHYVQSPSNADPTAVTNNTSFFLPKSVYSWHGNSLCTDFRIASVLFDCVLQVASQPSDAMCVSMAWIDWVSCWQLSWWILWSWIDCIPMLMCCGTIGRANMGVAAAASMIRMDWSCMFSVDA